MTTQITPSKQVRPRSRAPPWFTFPQSSSVNNQAEQAATGIDNLKMGESPAKKLDFEASNKENALIDVLPVDNVNLKKHAFDDVALQKPAVETKTEAKPTVAFTIKEDEADEPLLQENPHRFVLFPIKYHEVRRVLDASRIKSCCPI